MAVNPIPKGFRTVTPHLVCRNAGKALDFYQKAFGAEKVRLHQMPDGKVMHAEFRIGDSILMLADEYPDYQALSPQSLGGSSVTIHLYTPDADSLFQRAVSAGCTEAMPLSDQFWGDRYGQVLDPFGHKWSIATHKEDVSDEEVEKRGKVAMEQMSKQQK
jgi:uncharacterized glyoxalase superfamily protein PhnB